eukprot:159157_1
MGNHQAPKLEPQEKRKKTVHGYCDMISIDYEIPECIVDLITEYYYFGTICFDVYHSGRSQISNKGTLLKSKPSVHCARLFSTKSPLEKNIIHEIKFKNTISACCYSDVEMGITSDHEIKWIAKGLRTTDFLYGHQYYLCKQKNKKSVVYSKFMGCETKLFESTSQKQFGIDDYIGMIIDLKHHKLIFVENSAHIASININKSETYHIFFSFRDTKMVWQIISFDGNKIRT